MVFKVTPQDYFRNGKPKRRLMCSSCVVGKHRFCVMQFCTCICKEQDIQALIANNKRIEELGTALDA